MSHLRNVAKTGIVALALGAAVATSAGNAVADPSPSGFRTYAAVGSDTTQAVWNGLANGKKPAIPNVASYDATPIGSTIQTSPGGPSYLRPTGSGNGVKALSAAYDPANHVWNGSTLSPADLAFSRSSARPSTTTPGSDLVYIPFARDAVSVAINPDGAGTPTNFTTAQLTGIYGGSTVNPAGSGVSYATDGQPVVNGVELTPLLPQSGSGTRSFFLSAVGVTTPASYINANSSIIENDGSFVDQPGELIPFSAAQWIAQFNKVQTNTIAGLQLTKINNLAPFTGKKKLAAGPLFGTADKKGVYQTAPTPGVGVFNRDTYNVVPGVDFGDTATAAQQQLVEMLTGTATGDLGNKKAVGIITQYGFGQLGYIGNSAQYLTSAFVH